MEVSSCELYIFIRNIYDYEEGIYDIELNYADVNGCRDTFLHPTSIVVNGGKMGFAAFALL